MTLMELEDDEVALINNRRFTKKLQEQNRLAMEHALELCGGNHNFAYDGHGHNYSVYKCTRCGFEEER